ncbi:MAG: tetratricopeptide repeat protein [Bacteroidales bacterium]|nr:tetratricopeptide repeat protein [Bacteroidales bacterium]
MSKKKDTSTEGKGLESIESTLTKSEQFIQKNQKILTYVLLGIVAVVGLYWAFMKFYKQPREKEAISQMFVAQQNFQIDSFALALNGNAAYPGFIGIIEDYSGTAAANLSQYYTGVCYMNMGDFDKAIEYLKDFKTSDLLLGSEKNGIIGDAYVEKGDFEKAITFYKKAVSEDYKNDFTTPIYLKKLGLVYENQGQKDKALEVYENIYYNHPRSNEARTIEKYIERAKLNM